MNTIPYLQIGKGRLGTEIIQAIHLDNQLSRLLLSTSSPNSRINPESGLILTRSSNTPVTLDKLVICIAPGTSKKWRWGDIFKGLLRQVQQQQLKINELIFISSTRIYDGISSGVVTAEDKPNPKSERAKDLFVAEQQLTELATTHCFLRCCGLIGEQYLKFQEILKRPDEKVRFAVDIKQVAAKVIERLVSKPLGNQYSVVTDGNCYYRGERLSLEQSMYLSAENRLLQNSDWFDRGS